MLHEARFSELALIMLRRVGWSAARHYDPTHTIKELQQLGWNPLFPAALEILRSLGDLSLRSVRGEPPFPPQMLADGSIAITGSGDCDFLPLLAHKIEADLVPQWQDHILLREAGLDICPIGTYAEDEALFVLSDGRIFRGKCYDTPELDQWPVSLLFLGDSIYDALNREALGAVYL